MNINDVLYLIQTSNLQGTTKSFLTSVLKAKRLQEGDAGYDWTNEQVRDAAGQGEASGTTFDTSVTAMTTKAPVDSGSSSGSSGPKRQRLTPGSPDYLTDEQVNAFLNGQSATAQPTQNPRMVMEKDIPFLPGQSGRPRKPTDARRITDEDLAAMGTSEAEIQKQLGQAAPGAKKQGSGLRSFFSDLSKRLSGGRSKKAPAQPTSQPATRSANPARNISTEEVKRSGLTDEEIRRITGT
jgi:hypothetical protein